MAIKKYSERRSHIKTIGKNPLHQTLRSEPLSQSHPMLIEEWIDKGPCSPDEISAGSGKQIDWQCIRCGNKLFKVPVNRRTRAIDEGNETQGCSYCSKRKRNSKQKGNPLASSLIEECIDEPGLTKKELLLDNSTQLRLWRCSTCSHEYRTRINARVGSPRSIPQDCPACYKGFRVNLSEEPHKEFSDLFKKGKKNRGFDSNSLPFVHKVFWTCTNNPRHAVYCSIGEFVEDGCKNCLNNGEHAFLSSNKELASQFVEAIRYPHWTAKNIRLGSSMVAVWQCPISKDHVWSRAIFRRTLDGQGCPFCSGKRLSVSDSLASEYPHLATEWNYEENEITPDQIKATDKRKFWFSCKKGHPFEASPWERTRRKVGCKICATVENSVAENHPALINEWHRTKNGHLSPWNTKSGSNKKVWWRCLTSADHIYQRRVFDRCVRSSACPICQQNELALKNILPGSDHN